MTHPPTHPPRPRAAGPVRCRPLPLLLAVSLVLPAAAQPPAPGPAAERAAAEVRRSTGGRVLKVQPEDGGHRVRVLLPDGRVRSLQVAPPGPRAPAAAEPRE